MDTVTALPGESELVLRSVTEPAAFASIYDYYFPRLYKYMLYRIGNIYEAEDLTSQVFERVIIKIGSYRPELGTFAGWLFTIAHNTVINHLRMQKRSRTVPLEVIGETACAGAGPEETAIHNENREKLLNALSYLTNRERSLIALKFSAGLTNRAIANISGLSESNVAVILYRAVRRLRQGIDAQEKIPIKASCGILKKGVKGLLRNYNKSGAIKQSYMICSSNRKKFSLQYSCRY